MPESFPPVYHPQSKTLILGSLPGKRSLTEHEYYAHPRNAFWSIMETLYGISTHWDYARRIKALTDKRLALWDVIYSCDRSSSLDSDIIDKTLIINDFKSLFKACPKIEKICFNGQKSAKLYRQSVQETLSEKHQNIMHSTLPSTSPALARLSLQQKTDLWKTALFD